LLQRIKSIAPAAVTVLFAPAAGKAQLGRAYSAGATMCIDDDRGLTAALAKTRGLRARLASYEQTLARFRAFHRSLSRLSFRLPDPPDLLADLLEQVHSVVPYDVAMVVLRRGNGFVVMGSSGLGEFGRQLPEVEFPRTAVPLLTMLIAAGRPRVLAEPLRMFKRSCRSVLLAPMLLPPRIEGALLLLSEKANEYKPEEVEPAALLADRFALALSNMLHYAELSKEARRLASLLETNAELSQAQGIEAMLELAVAEAARLTSSKICTVRLVEGDYLTEGIAHGYQRPLSRLHRIRIDERLSAIVHGLKPLIIDDLMKDPGLPASRRERSIREGVRAFLGVPMMYEEKSVGIFSLYKSDPHEWSREEIALVKALAARTADEINSLRSYQRLVASSG
jgi:GAF domain-containing protein